MPVPAARLLRGITRVLVVAVLITASTESVATARAGPPVPVATLSISADVQGSDGLPPDLDILVVYALDLAVNERACGGPSFNVMFQSYLPGKIFGGDADALTVTDAEIFRVDVQVPVAVDGADCEYTIDPTTQGLVCYRAVDVVAAGVEGEDVLNVAGVPTGEAVSPTGGEVVPVTATYADACSEIRVEVDGLGDRDGFAQMDAETVDSADRSVWCDFVDIGPSPVPFRFSSGTLLVTDAAPAGCVATLTLTAEGCTITPISDQFIIEHPVTTRRLSATCAPAAPVPAEPAFTG